MAAQPGASIYSVGPGISAMRHRGQDARGGPSLDADHPAIRAASRYISSNIQLKDVRFSRKLPAIKVNKT